MNADLKEKFVATFGTKGDEWELVDEFGVTVLAMHDRLEIYYACIYDEATHVYHFLRRRHQQVQRIDFPGDDITTEGYGDVATVFLANVPRPDLSKADHWRYLTCIAALRCGAKDLTPLTK